MIVNQSAVNPGAGIAQLVERNLAKVEVASSNLVSRSISFLSSLLNLKPELKVKAIVNRGGVYILVIFLVQLKNSSFSLAVV